MITVVIIVYNKAKELPLVLRGLQCQTEFPGGWEILLLDDGSTDGSPDIAEAHAAGLPMIVRRLRHSGNRNALRNMGIAAARGERIAFLDGDIVPRPDFARGHARFGSGPEVLIAPRLNLPPIPDNAMLKANLDADIRYLHSLKGDADERNPHFRHRSLECQPHPWRFLHSHNFSASARMLGECCGFDEALSAWGADDLELGYRLRQAGGEFRFSEAAGGTHLHHPPSMAQGRYAQNLTRFFRKFPAPEVELLFIEASLTPMESFKCFTEVENLPVAEPGKEFPWPIGTGRILANGVAYPGSLKVSGLGLQPWQDQVEFDIYVVSGNLCILGANVFRMVLENGRKRAAKVVVLDPRNLAGGCLAEISYYLPHFGFEREGCFWKLFWEAEARPPRCLFLLNNASDPLLKNYQLSLLAQAGDGLERDYSCIRDFVVDGSTDEFLGHEARIRSLSPGNLSGRSFVFHPPWLKSEAAKYGNPVSIYWEESTLLNPDTVKSISDGYDLILMRCEDHLRIFRALDPNRRFTALLEPCLDEKIFHPPVELAEAKEKFIVTHVSKYSVFGTGYDLFLRAFAEEFQDDDAVECRIVFAPYQNISYGNPYLSARHARLHSEWNRLQERALHWYSDQDLADLGKELGKVLGNITVHTTNIGDSGLAALLRETDLYVDPSRFSSPRSITLCALACGAKAAVPDSYRNLGFYESTMTTFIPTTPVAGDLFGIKVAPLGGGTVPDESYKVAREIDSEALRGWMRKEYEDWLGGRFRKEPDEGRRLAEKHAASSQIRNLEAILQRYPT